MKCLVKEKMNILLHQEKKTQVEPLYLTQHYKWNVKNKKKKQNVRKHDIDVYDRKKQLV